MVCDMPKQYGSNDCGLFALASSIAIFMDKNPAKYFFTKFDSESFQSSIKISKFTTI
jgi:hypothetical protein